jgi:type IV pilus assembly protein PilA
MSHYPQNPQPQPPPGGFGAPYGQGGMGPVPTPPGRSTGALIAIIAVVVVGVLVAIVGIFAVLGIYGTRKYIANAKTAEARNYLGMMAKDAVNAYESEELSAESDTPSGVYRRLCPSARSPVPSSLAMVRGVKYQSASSDWKSDPGFSCLHFEVSSPQYYQYNYSSTSDAFTGTAKGDLNGDGMESTFEIKGMVQSGRVVVSPSILETNPEE